MDFYERLAIVRRICNGYLYGLMPYNDDSYYVKFKDPTLPLLAEADWIYKKHYDDTVSNSTILTEKEAYSLLEQNNIWSTDMEKEMLTLQKDIDTMQEGLPGLKFNKTALRRTTKAITQAKKRLEELYLVKNQLRSATAEFLAEKSRKRFIISKIVELDNVELLDIPIFKDALVVYYFEESGISESKLRELARTDPWRLYWTTSKDTGTPLFPHPATHMTDLQYSLVYWTRVYDFAFNSMNRPAEDVIVDDERFDAWYKGEIKRIESEHKQSANQNDIGGSGFGSKEVYLPADLEGSREVYDLNSIEGRLRIKQRETAIKQKGEVAEQALPDVSNDIKMGLNRIASEGIKNRS